MKQEPTPSPYKDKLFTIPNLLSLFRLALIPVILWLYIGREACYWAAGLVALSGATDILDGKIARKYNMISDVGKILDPVADKLTQISLLFCLVSRYAWLWYLVGFFVCKELLQALMGYVVLRRKESVDGAQWFSKASTVVFYGVMILLFVFPALPEIWPQGLCGLSGGMLLLSLVMYLRYDFRELKKMRKQQ